MHAVGAKSALLSSSWGAVRSSISRKWRLPHSRSSKVNTTTVLWIIIVVTVLPAVLCHFSVFVEWHVSTQVRLGQRDQRSFSTWQTESTTSQALFISRVLDLLLDCINCYSSDANKWVAEIAASLQYWGIKTNDEWLQQISILLLLRTSGDLEEC